MISHIKKSFKEVIKLYPEYWEIFVVPRIGKVNLFGKILIGIELIFIFAIGTATLPIYFIFELGRKHE